MLAAVSRRGIKEINKIDVDKVIEKQYNNPEKYFYMNELDHSGAIINLIYSNIILQKIFFHKRYLWPLLQKLPTKTKLRQTEAK